MKEIRTQSRKDRSRFEARIVLVALAIVVIIGLGATTYTASGAERDRLPSGQMRYFDPFRLTTIYLDVPESAPMAGIASAPETASSPRVTEAGAVPVYSPPIMISHRPTIRSPFRPPWVPGPPVSRPPFTPPGPPPWVLRGPPSQAQR